MKVKDTIMFNNIITQNPILAKKRLHVESHIYDNVNFSKAWIKSYLKL